MSNFLNLIILHFFNKIFFIKIDNKYVLITILELTLLFHYNKCSNRKFLFYKYADVSKK